MWQIKTNPSFVVKRTIYKLKTEGNVQLTNSTIELIRLLLLNHSLRVVNYLLSLQQNITK